ncbi:alpha/beta hydrolase [Dyella koreensis]|uniref:Esterase family protein n=1 Tax=Dyella koreensis TaxID=311235 RepID=A0ABW8K9U8_9GAMM
MCFRFWLVLSLLVASGTATAQWPGHPEERLSVQENTPAIGVSELQLKAPGVSPQPMHISVYLPPGYAAHPGRHYPVLYANDGQDMGAVGLSSTLAALYRDRLIEPIIVVAVDMPPDRAGAYGLSDRKQARSVVGDSRIGPIGTHAQDYTQWFVTRLVPAVDARFRTQRTPEGRAVLGWSLGGLHAFNLAWQYPELFGRVGAFSPSFWLAKDRSDGLSIDRTRFALHMVDASRRRPSLKLWFSVGSAEETDDRDHDGVIDAIGDVRDLIEGYRIPGGGQLRGLRQLGYRVDMDYAQHPSRQADVAFYLLDEGKHNQASWAMVLPPFLQWAYGSKSASHYAVR